LKFRSTARHFLAVLRLSYTGISPRYIIAPGIFFCPNLLSKITTPGRKLYRQPLRNRDQFTQSVFANGQIVRATQNVAKTFELPDFSQTVARNKCRAYSQQWQGQSWKKLFVEIAALSKWLIGVEVGPRLVQGEVDIGIFVDFPRFGERADDGHASARRYLAQGGAQVCSNAQAHVLTLCRSPDIDLFEQGH
jgi:hypothetical protein